MVQADDGGVASFMELGSSQQLSYQLRWGKAALGEGWRVMYFRELPNDCSNADYEEKKNNL